MMPKLYPPIQGKTHHRKVHEKELVELLCEVVLQAGILADPLEIENFYVCIKSNPMVLLKGPVENGKLDFLRLFAEFIIGESNHQCQMMVGHPYWASGSKNVAMFTEAQARYITEKVICLIEEAWQPENRWKMYLACLAQVSPAEIESFFVPTAFQLGHGQIIRLPYAHFTKPIPFPSNLFLVGTMDSDWYHTFGSDLLMSTAIIDWPEKSKRRYEFSDVGSNSRSGEKVFLQSSIRSEYAARSKLRRILGWGMEGLEPIRLIEDLFEIYGYKLSQKVMGQVMTYLANAWTKEGIGLFAASTQSNLLVSLDLAISQYLLPHYVDLLQDNQDLYGNLSRELDDHFPRSREYLKEHTPQVTNLKAHTDTERMDPVCGMQVDPEMSAGKIEHQGRTYHFCSEGCLAAFSKNPGNYVN
ncbi:MAG: YHS domain-containing protein [Anaerolineales bacterium]